jgi:pimeloyl-ACP methyl ester carboxylesterase
MKAKFIGLLTACVIALAPASLAQTTAAQSFDSNGVQISYADRGRGVPVVLIHGFTGTYARHWEGPGVMQALETAGYRVVAMDCRGHGQSGKPADPAKYGMEMVADVLRLLDHLKIERAHVVGYSMGGAIANQLLVRNPERLLTVTLLGAGWAGDDLTELTAMMNAMADGFARRDASVLVRLVNSSATAQPSEQEIAAMNAALFARNDPQALSAVARTLPALMKVPADQLRKTTLPVLALIGDQDLSNLQSVRRMKDIMPRLEVVELPGATHASSVRPAAEPLVAFLNKHRRS